MIELAKQLYRDANVKGVLFILNKVRDDLTEQFLLERLAQKDIEPLGIIHDTPALSMAWLLGEPLIKTHAQSEANNIVEALEKVDEEYAPLAQEVRPV